MKRIGLISDTHSHLPQGVFEHFADVDEIWHAGDFGDMQLITQLSNFKPLCGVYGNIDGSDIRKYFPETRCFMVEGVKVLMRHIGGYPKKYAPGIKALIQQERPQLFISGHSHILKIMYDDALQCLHMNPGACGQHGWHTVKTLIRFSIDGTRIFDCEVIELGKRGQ